jgi:hypothetical protein
MAPRPSTLEQRHKASFAVFDGGVSSRSRAQGGSRIAAAPSARFLSIDNHSHTGKTTQVWKLPNELIAE